MMRTGLLAGCSPRRVYDVAVKAAQKLICYPNLDAVTSPQRGKKGRPSPQNEGENPGDAVLCTPFLIPESKRKSNRKHYEKHNIWL